MAGLKSAINCDNVKVVAAISVYINWIYVYIFTDLSIHVGRASFGDTSEVASCACNEGIRGTDSIADFIHNLLAVDGNEWSALGIRRFTPRERIRGTDLRDDCLGRSSGRFEKESSVVGLPEFEPRYLRHPTHT